MGSFILGINIIFSTVHVFVRDRSVPTPVKGLFPSHASLQSSKVPLSPSHAIHGICAIHGISRTRSWVRFSALSCSVAYFVTTTATTLWSAGGCRRRPEPVLSSREGSPSTPERETNLGQWNPLLEDTPKIRTPLSLSS